MKILFQQPASGDEAATMRFANHAGFAPTKAAQRSLAESIARELGQKIQYVLIDAVIDCEWTRKRFADVPDDSHGSDSRIGKCSFRSPSTALTQPNATLVMLEKSVHGGPCSDAGKPYSMNPMRKSRIIAANWNIKGKALG